MVSCKSRKASHINNILVLAAFQKKCNNRFMSESTPQVTESMLQTKDALINPRAISKTTDQEGRDKLSKEVMIAKKDLTEANKEIKNTAQQYEERQNNLIFKIRSKIGRVDQKSEEIWKKHLEAIDKKAQLPNPQEMINAYYEKKSTEPLTNREKRELLKPEVLSQLTTDEYIALWKRLNPYFLTHVKRQGFRDHSGMVYHSAGLQEFRNGFVRTITDEKKLRPPFASFGLKDRDETSVEMFLSKSVLQAENEKKALERFDDLMNIHTASAPKYPDKTAVHFANQLVADEYYGGESNNEIFFVFPTDVIASQYNYAFNGWEKDFTKPQSETTWNDIFVWPNTLENPGISIDSGVVFLPENTRVDPKTGSKYASEIKQVEGVEKKVMVEDTEKVKKFMDWAQSLNNQSEIVKAAKRYYNERSYSMQRLQYASLVRACSEELKKLGFDQESARHLSSELMQTLIYWDNETSSETFQDLIDASSAKYKMADNTIPSKEYWEKYFAQNPQLRPKHIIYYDGNPTSAVYKFQQENNIGKADTSNTEGILLGFNDHNVTDMKNDSRANMGQEDLLKMGDEIIKKHYAFSSTS